MKATVYRNGNKTPEEFSISSFEVINASSRNRYASFILDNPKQNVIRIDIKDLQEVWVRENRKKRMEIDNLP